MLILLIAVNLPEFIACIYVCMNKLIRAWKVGLQKEMDDENRWKEERWCEHNLTFGAL